MKPGKNETNYVIRLTLVATLGGFLFGYDTAVVSGAITAIQNYLVIPFAIETGRNASSVTGFTVSAALIGCIAGGALAGLVSMKIGRRGGLMLAAIMFLLSGLGSAFPEKMALPGMSPIVSFILYRISGGLGIGLASMLSPMYIAEIAPAESRGKLVSWNQFAIVTGILIVYFVNWFIAGSGDEQWNQSTGWRYMFLSGALPSVIFIFLLFLIPETPRYLVLKNKTSAALEVLKRTVGPGRAETSLNEITSSLVVKSAPWLSFGWGVLITGILLAAFQQFIGINVVLYYAPKIFQNMGTRLDVSLLQTILVGAVNMIFTIVAIFTVDRLGRKPLLIAGGLLMAVAMTALGFTFFLGKMGLSSLVFIIIYIAGFAMSWGPVMWVLLSEMFPNSIRGAMSLATATVWISDFIVSWTFPVMDENQWLAEKFNHGFAYWLYAVICVIAVLFVWKIVPETKGKTLEEIENIWRP